MDKIKLNIFKRLAFSINPKKYIFLYKEKLSKAILYILLLAVILGGIQGAFVTVILSGFEKAAEIALKEDDLQFEMKDGILDFKSSPFKEEEGQVLLLIDTTKSIDEIDSLKNITVHKNTVTVLLKDGLMTKENSNEVIYKYSELGLDKFYFDNNIIVTALSQINIIKYMIIPVIILFKFIEMIIYALIISIMGLVSNLMIKRKMKYSSLFNLSSPAVLLISFSDNSISLFHKSL